MNHQARQQELATATIRSRPPPASTSADGSLFHEYRCRQQVRDVCDRLASNAEEALPLDDDGWRCVRLKFLYPRMKPVETAALLEALRANRHVESLNLYESVRPDDATGVTALLTALCRDDRFLPNLRVLNLGGNYLTDEHAELIARALCRPRTRLKALFLAGNRIRHPGVEAIGRAVRYQAAHFPAPRCLEELRMSGNPLGSMGIKLFVQAAFATAPEHGTDTCRCRCRLRTLCLANTQAKDKGAKYLARALTKNPTCQLQQLFLGYNKITDEGCCALARALRHNDALSALCLGSNDITEVGATFIAESLERNNYALEAIRIYTNVQARIQKACTQNKQIHGIVQRLLLSSSTTTTSDAQTVNDTKNDQGHQMMVDDDQREQRDGELLETITAEKLWPHVLAQVNTKPDSLFVVLQSTNPEILTT